MDQQKKRLMEILRGFKTGVLVTKAADGDLHGRPMEVAKVEDDGGVYFSASLNSPKIQEIVANATVGLFFQESNQWVSLSGKAQIERRRELIDELWQESWKVWFPDGKESPDICLIHVRPNSAEYWDVSGQRGVKYVFQAVKAYMSGTRPQLSQEEHGKLAM